MNFYIRCILFGMSLATDACAVSATNGIKYPNLKKSIVLFSCILFGFFQGVMPFVGYFTGHTLLPYIEEYIPWLSLVILSFLGVNMLMSSFQSEDVREKEFAVKEIFIQAIVTSLDALSVGFTIANYTLLQAIQCMSIVAGITFLLCFFGYAFGNRFGNAIGKTAEGVGGLILIAIGIEIFLKGRGYI